MTELEKNRLKINEADKKIAALFEQRMNASKNIALYKREHGLPILDSAREREVRERELEFIGNPEYKSAYLELLQSMMDISKKYQRRILQGSRVAYCGIEGAWANIAAKRIFPQGIPVSFSSFVSAYEAVVEGDCDYAVLPLENSYAGNVSRVFDLMRGPLFINGMYSLRVTQSLLGVPGATLSDIKKVISHQQALDQCMGFLRSGGFMIQAAENTATSAKMVASLNDKSVAAIASEESAALYGLEVLRKEINQNALNTTRFAVFCAVRNEELSPGSNCLFQMMFTVRNVPGSLAGAINTFSEAGINLRSLQSRPIKDIPWQYCFYAEGEGSLRTEAGQKLLKKLEKSCEEVKVLGHYLGDVDI